MSHKTRRITSFWGQHIYIDCGIVDLVEQIWSLKIPTVFSCEDSLGNGECVQISVPSCFNKGYAVTEFAEHLYFAATRRQLDLRPLAEAAAKMPVASGIEYREYDWRFLTNHLGDVHCLFSKGSVQDVMKKLQRFETLCRLKKVA